MVRTARLKMQQAGIETRAVGEVLRKFVQTGFPLQWKSPVLAFAKGNTGDFSARGRTKTKVPCTLVGFSESRLGLHTGP
jgi:hypothetical protein